MSTVKKMRNLIMAGLLCLSISSASAQWYLSGNNIVNSNSGNVGVGTVSPGQKLEVRGGNISTSGSLYLGNNMNSSVRRLYLSDGDDNHYLYSSGTGGNNFFFGEYLAGGNEGFHWINTNGGGEIMTINGVGNIGINTASPAYKLHVVGSSHITDKAWFTFGNASMAGYSWVNAAVTTNSIEIVNNQGTVTNSSPTLAFHRYGSGGPQFRLAADGSNILYLESSGENSARNPNPYGGGPNQYFARLHVDGSLSTTGNIAIGTVDTKGYKLAVAGNIISESVTVKIQSQWPDYVFRPSYRLLPLTKVQSFIQKNGHLPEIPSKIEIKEKGVDVGKMLKLQTKKIEELTLYLIQQQKQINTLRTELVALRKKTKSTQY